MSFATSRGSEKLYIGEAAPMSSLIYAASGKMDTVYLVPDVIMPRLANDLDDFRDRTAIPFDITDVIKIDIKEPSVGLVLLKQDGAWWITEPAPTLAQEQTVDSLLVPLKILQVEEFADDSPVTLEPYGLKNPKSVITLTLSGGGTTGIRIGRTDRQNKRCYVMREGDPYIFVVDAEQIDLFNMCTEYLRRTLQPEPEKSDE